MKKISERFRFEGWKAIPLFALIIKLIADAALFFMSVKETVSIVGLTSERFRSRVEYIGKFGWFMYVCFGVIIAFDIIMLLRVIFSSQHKLHRLQPNTNLDLFLKNSRIKAEKFCLKTLVFLLIPFVFMTAYMKRIVEDILPAAVISYAVIYLVILATIIKSLMNVSKRKKHSRDMLIFLKASKVEYNNYAGSLLNENAVVFENLTDYMISSFSTGNFSPTGTIFYDLSNELIPWLGEVPEFNFDIVSRRNHVVVADFNKIEDLSGFIKRIYDNFRHNSSKYACLTVGLVNARNISEKDFDFGLAKDIKIVSFSSYKALELMSLSAGRIPVINEVGTSEENREAIRIAGEMVELSQNPYLLTKNFSDLFTECSDISSERYNGETEPDYNYALTSIVLQKISTLRMRSIFLSRYSCYCLTDPERRVCDEFRKIGVKPEINPDNEFLYSILKNILFEPSEVKRIMGLFDYIDFMLRTVGIYSYIKRGGKAEDYEIESSFYSLAYSILENTPETNRTIRRIIELPTESPINMIMGTVKLYFNLISATCNFDLCGLCHLIDIVRNKTRGHGSIKEENSCIINSFLLIAVEMLHDFLDIRNFNITVENNSVFIGYGKEKYDCSSIICAVDGLPCIPIRMQGESKEYINFFKGKYIVPEFVRADRE